MMEDFNITNKKKKNDGRLVTKKKKNHPAVWLFLETQKLHKIEF